MFRSFMCWLGWHQWINSYAFDGYHGNVVVKECCKHCGRVK